MVAERSNSAKLDTTAEESVADLSEEGTKAGARRVMERALETIRIHGKDPVGRESKCLTGASSKRLHDD
jgi:hypothetical protein